MQLLFGKSVQYVTGDDLNDGIFPLKAVRPVGRRRCKNSATRRNPVYAHAGITCAPAFPPLIPMPLVRRPTRRRQRQDQKVFRRSIPPGRYRLPVHKGVFTSITLVTNDTVPCAELLSLFEAGSGENPMIRLINGKRTRPVHVLSIAAMHATEHHPCSDQLILRPVHKRMAPQG